MWLVAGVVGYLIGSTSFARIVGNWKAPGTDLSIVEYEVPGSDEVWTYRGVSATSVTKRIGPGPVARILCIPQLPASGDLKKKTITLLREKGIDGVISYPTMLSELIKHVDTNKNYEKSNVLQMIRILKTYGLFKDDQLDLFSSR